MGSRDELFANYEKEFKMFDHDHSSSDSEGEYTWFYPNRTRNVLSYWSLTGLLYKIKDIPTLKDFQVLKSNSNAKPWLIKWTEDPVYKKYMNPNDQSIDKVSNGPEPTIPQCAKVVAK